MGYNDERQSLSAPIEDICSGIDAFWEAAIARAHSGEWRKEHIREIMELADELRGLQVKLIQLDVW